MMVALHVSVSSISWLPDELLPQYLCHSLPLFSIYLVTFEFSHESSGSGDISFSVPHKLILLTMATLYVTVSAISWLPDGLLP